MKKLNILVCGAGGDIGQSILKCLKEISFINRIYATDITYNTPSKFLYDKLFIVPPCTSVDYIPLLSKLIVENNIDFIIPVSDIEVRFFHDKGVRKISNKEVLLPNPMALEIGLNKYKTAIFLKKNNLPFPKTQMISEPRSLPFPLIAKDNTGSGSKQVFLVETQEDYQYVKHKYRKFILQEYIGDNENEFTCGLFRSKSGIIRTIVFRRTLSEGGYSSFGETIQNDIVDKILRQLAESLSLIGSVNVQMRMGKHGPTTFEINPRFSSTVMFRNMLGFKDVMWCIEDRMDTEISDYENVPEGVKFYKGFSEYID